MFSRFAFARRSFVPVSLACFCVAAAGQQILEVSADSLTTYKATGATPVQGIRPLAQQRGVNLDGSSRGPMAQPMAFAGNPFENAWRGHFLENGLRLDLGAYSPFDVDLSLPAVIPWVVGRTYNPLQENSGSTHIDSDGYQGANWAQVSQPELVLYDDFVDTKDTLYLVYGADRYLEFVRTGTGSTQYKGKNGVAGVFDFQVGVGGGAVDLWVWTDQHGNEATFFGFDADAGVAAGQLWKIADPSWNGSTGSIAFVGDKSTASTAISSGFDGAGRILKAYDSSDRRLTYTYTTLNSVVRLTEVVAEIRTGGTWASPTGVSEVGRVEYSYYGNETDGDIGDLKLVAITTPLSDSAVEVTKRQHYRYWEGSYNGSSNPGLPHQVRLVLGFEGARRFDLSIDSTLDEDYTATSTYSIVALQPYASAYFEYASDRRVRLSWSDGNCGCGGGSDGVHEYTYDANADYSDSNGYQQLWAKRTLVERPDGSFLTQYFDEVGQTLSEVISDTDPTTASSYWATEVLRNAGGIIEETRTPANNDIYYHNDTGTPPSVIPAGTFVDDSVGLVWHFDRETSGDLTGFQKGKKYSNGAGTAYYDSSIVWTSKSRTVGASGVVRPLVNKTRSFATAQSSETGYEETEHTYVSYGGSSDVVIEKITTTKPIVATGNNGPGGSYPDVTDKHLNKSGQVDFEKVYLDPSSSPANWIIRYFEYEDGQLTKDIADANTSSGDVGVSVPSGFSSISGAKLHKMTATAYLPAGMKQLLTPPGGEDVASIYYSKLGDDRLVTLEYNDFGSGTFYGPVDYTVTNHAGKVEARGLIGLTGNTSSAAQSTHIDETEADLIATVDNGFGTLARLSVSILDETGTHVEEERAYFSLPSSGAGTEGTHYDATRFGYDDLGRRVRTKEPSGTIYRVEYDIFGRTTDRWMGTNDQSFPGGESSGTDDMTKTEHLVYDAGTANKNGLLTSRTAYIQDTTTGQRVTEYEHDLRGRVIFEEPPLAPYAVHKYDNRGARIATGQYSSASGLSASTDPTSNATNRLALSETAYDEQGRAWKTIRHKIDPADGSDDDTLESLSWFDRRGQIVKEDGETLRKTRYDRLGRTTDEFILAEDDDSAYADVDDMSGDIVYEQHQTRYDATHDTVVMRVSIERLYSDYGGSETAAELDTNADGDNLLLTMSTTAASSNVKGRPRITAYWYDRMKREKTRAEYGTHLLANFDRDGLSEPSASASDKLVTKTAYATDGTVLDVTNPRGIVNRTEHDALGRTTKEIRNYLDGTPNGSDEDVTIRYEYAKGLRTRYVADLPSGQADQETLYIYGTTKGTPSASKVSSGHLLRATKYPDSTNSGTTASAINSDSSDVVSHAYDAQGAEVYRKDQAGNVFELDRDGRGRETAKKVTTLGSGFDGAVRRIETGFDGLGRRSTVTQYDAATSGSIVDQVAYTYDGWGGLTKFEQDRDSAVGASGSVNDYEVSYAFAKATSGRNTIRRTSMTMPSGAVVEYKYRTRNGIHDDEASRVTDLVQGATTLAAYDYNGAGTVVGTDYPEPNVMWWQHDTSTWNSFPDLDRWGRVVRSRWTKDLTTDVDFYRVELTYDENSNITSADDSVHAGFDVKYVMDDIDRLIDADEGTLSAGSITSRTRRQEWALGQTGNWDEDKLDLNGDGDWGDTNEVDDCRTHNVVNELTARNTNCSGGNEFTLAYDAVGNVTDDSKDYEYEWDAFGRLRKVKNTLSSALIAEYRYNGLGYRIGVHTDSDLDFDVDASDHWYYTAFEEQWRAVARYRSQDADPKEEYTLHNAGLGGEGTRPYTDLNICRQRDTTTTWTSASDGVLEERTYYLQNYHADSIALIESSGLSIEGVRYRPYGNPFGLPAGDTDSNGNCTSIDVSQISSWIGASYYSVLGDVNLDGVLDSADSSLVSSAPRANVIAGLGVLSPIAKSFIGTAGSEQEIDVGLVLNRNRVRSVEYGRWLSRDRVEYLDGSNLYQAVASNPASFRDPTGTVAVPAGGGCTGGCGIPGPIIGLLAGRRSCVPCSGDVQQSDSGGDCGFAVQTLVNFPHAGGGCWSGMLPGSACAGECTATATITVAGNSCGRGVITVGTQDGSAPQFVDTPNPGPGGTPPQTVSKNLECGTESSWYFNLYGADGSLVATATLTFKCTACGPQHPL